MLGDSLIGLYRRDWAVWKVFRCELRGMKVMGDGGRLNLTR